MSEVKEKFQPIIDKINELNNDHYDDETLHFLDRISTRAKTKKREIEISAAVNTFSNSKLVEKLSNLILENKFDKIEVDNAFDFLGTINLNENEFSNFNEIMLDAISDILDRNTGAWIKKDDTGLYLVKILNNCAIVDFSNKTLFNEELNHPAFLEGLTRDNLSGYLGRYDFSYVVEKSGDTYKIL